MRPVMRSRRIKEGSKEGHHMPRVRREGLQMRLGAKQGHDDVSNTTSFWVSSRSEKERRKRLQTIALLHQIINCLNLGSFLNDMRQLSEGEAFKACTSSWMCNFSA